MVWLPWVLSGGHGQNVQTTHTISLSEIGRYGVALALVLLAFIVHYSLRLLLGDHLVFLAFLPAVLTAAWVGGFGPGILVLALGLVLGDFVFLPRRFEFVPSSTAEFSSLLVYLFVGVAGVAFIDRSQRIRHTLRVSEAQKQALESEVTERHRVENSLRSSETRLRAAQQELQIYANKLEERVADRTANLTESVAALENVLHHIAHDLRAPIRAMYSFTELLLEQYGSRFDARGKSYAVRIADACRRMDKLTSALLEYGGLAHEPVSLVQVDLNEIFQQVLALCEPQVKGRSAQIELEQPLPKVTADPALLERALAHLIRNALKFVPTWGRPRIEVWGESKGDTVRVHIRDHGIGIKPQYLARIFSAFERLPDNGESYDGTGIGLAIVKRCVERMGGQVGVESTPGVGSRFWIELKTDLSS